MGLDICFDSVPRGADVFKERDIVEEKLGFELMFGLYQTSSRIAQSRLYEVCTYVEEDWFTGSSYWWLDKYFKEKLNNRGSIEDGVQLFREDLVDLMDELNKTIDSMDIEITYNKEKRFPEYHLLNPNNIYLGLFDGDSSLIGDDTFHRVLSVWHSVNRKLKEFPWEERDMYYHSSS